MNAPDETNLVDFNSSVESLYHLVHLRFHFWCFADLPLIAKINTKNQYCCVLDFFCMHIFVRTCMVGEVDDNKNLFR